MILKVNLDTEYSARCGCGDVTAIQVKTRRRESGLLNFPTDGQKMKVE